MRALLIPCGIGMGHVSRCLALASQLEKEGYEIQFASYGSGYQLLCDYTNYSVFKLPKIKFYGGGGEINLKHTAKKSIDAPFTFLKSIYHESRIIKDFKPDVVISDSHYSVPITCKVLGVPTVLVTNDLTLDFSEVYPQDRSMEYLENGLQRFIQDSSKLCRSIIIPDINGSSQIPEKLEDKTVFTGPILKEDPQNMLSREELREREGFKQEDRIVLATIGGTSFGRKLLEMLSQALKMIHLDHMVMVTGPGMSTDFLPASPHIISKQFLGDMMDWMKLSDLAVSLAGHTTSMELASLGVRNILVPLENHPEQLRNSMNMQQHGLSHLEFMEDLNPAKLAENINHLLDSDELVEGARTTQQKFSQYQGTQEAVSIIRQCAETR